MVSPPAIAMLNSPSCHGYFIGLVELVKITTDDWRSLSVACCFTSCRTAHPSNVRDTGTTILPALFTCGIGIQLIIERLKGPWSRGLLLYLIAVDGIYGLISHHPYQYTYYNALVGGTQGAFRRFETDYWLTCYKEVMEEHINASPTQYPEIHVLRNYSV
jgi:hypothetical protein